MPCNRDHHFDDLVRCLRAARIHYGIQFTELDTDQDVPSQDELKARSLQLSPTRNADQFRASRQHFTLANIQYPDGRSGLLVYVTPSFTGDESLELLQYRASSKDFPHETSNDQLFVERSGNMRLQRLPAP